MVISKEIACFLDEELRINEIKDTSNNGLQVENQKDIKKVGFAVDACMETFELAKEKKCEMIIVHHGMIWGGLPSITGIDYKRIKFLIENNISLYASHLPLDLNEEHGNNIELVKLLKLNNVKPFGNYRGTNIGFKGECNSSLENIKKVLKNGKMKISSLDFGEKNIKKVGIISGGGSSGIDEAIRDDLDLFIIGEGEHELYHKAKEGKMNVIMGGHYETEVFGVKKLMSTIKDKFNLKVEFIDVPTDI